MKTVHVNSGLNELLNNGVQLIVVVGKFGNLVSTTSRRISEAFIKKEKWKSREYRYTDIPDTVEENTIVYVYGWFGLWNDDLCSADRAKTVCKSLIRILNETNNVKIIVGMLSDLYKKYHQELEEANENQTFCLFHHEIYLDSIDDRNDAEYKIFFKESIQNHCIENDCPCKRFTYEMLRKGKDKDVGMPLKINVIRKHHELIPYYLNNWDILKVMGCHFSDMCKDSGKMYVYEWIKYICLKGKFRRSDEFDTKLVKEMNFEIEQSSFDEEDKELSRYIRIRNSDKLRNVLPKNAQYDFWHPFIYICAFHFLFHENPELVIKYCIVDAIVQLVRPKGAKTSYFEVAANEKWVTLFNERIRLLGKEKDYANNPLIKIIKGVETFRIDTIMDSMIDHHGS